MKKSHLFLKVSYRETPVVGTTTQAVIQGQQEDQIAQIESLISLVDSNPEMLKDPETKEIYEAYQALQTATTAPVQQAQQQQQQAPAAQQQAVATQHQVSEEDFVSKSLFFDGKEEINFDGITPESMASAIKEHFQYDTEQPTWAAKFLKDVNNNKVTISKLESVKEKFDLVTNQLENLPTPLLASMKAASEGKNWREELKNFDVDYSVKFDKLSEEEQVRVTKRLLPDIIVSDDTTKPEFKLALNLGKQAFENHQKSIEQETIKAQEAFARKQTSFLASVDESLKALSQKYEEFADEDNVKEIKALAKEGKILSLFYDDKGMLRKDALERLAYAKYGDKVIKKVSDSKGTRKANDAVADLIGGQQSQGVGSKGVNTITQQDEVTATTERAMKSYAPTY